MFKDYFKNQDWNFFLEKIEKMSELDVLYALQQTQNATSNVEHFIALISKAAAPFLDQMMQESRRITQARFGKNIHLYIPLYLSNECQNICTYCGFSYSNKIPRKTLNDDEIIKEIEIIKSYGYDSILLVTGEHDKLVGIDYLVHAVKLAKQYFSQVSIEVQPLDQQEYELLVEAGVYAVLVYQETYHQETYKQYHPKGKKSNFDYRLDTPDRLGKAGVHKIGIGALLGLEDWRVDSAFNAMHLEYLQRTYWQTKYSVSFPRIRPHEGGFQPKSILTEKELAQLICAYRLCFPDVELSLSSRERAQFRDVIFPYGITSMSAGSKTEPGGYANSKALKQFETNDDRSPQEIAHVIRNANYEAVWKDWDAVYVNG
ncbi:MAG: 2-iminoacetate synthase ThiH [Chitinophagales bacterium]|nr:2-iminoacetate synthase ThiH [Chitinophagales bacterium]MBP6154448.1 2-iminoacetate synthase ThiH [Chitinophagales bacterium]